MKVKKQNNLVEPVMQPCKSYIV